MALTRRNNRGHVNLYSRVDEECKQNKGKKTVTQLIQVLNLSIDIWELCPEMHAEDEIQTCSLWRHDVSTILNRYLKAVDSVKDEVIWKSEKTACGVWSIQRI